MRLLLDTRALLYFVAGDARLGSTARDAIESPTNEPLVSLASLWEIAIKTGLGRLEVGSSLDAFVDEHVVGNGIGLLRVRTEHLAALARLPFHHRDPFGRLLVAQAGVEGLPVVSSDPELAKYDVQSIW